MKFSAALILALSLGLALASCQKPQPPAETHGTTGVITALSADHKIVTIKHQAFPDGFMEAMEMSFELADPKLADGFKVGERVDFTLERRSDSFPIVSLTQAAK
jgi:Cu/Ag efflux protein CusF